MFKSIVQNWEASDKSREDRAEFAKNLHAAVIEMQELKYLLEHSIIKNVCIDSRKCYIELNDDYHNIKLIVNDVDFGSIPISILMFGGYEKLETQVVMNVMKYISRDNFTFLDIGANEGWYTLNVRKTFCNSKVYSFEPSPITCERMQENLIINNESTDKVENIGLYDKNDKLKFYYDEEGSGASSFMNIREKADIKPIEVDVRCLDDWARENDVAKIDFIKCDVEGAELFVYKGGREIIEQSKPIVFSEMLRKWSAKFGYTPNDIISFFKELGYKCYVIESETRLKECSKVTEETVETNYFFLHEIKHAQIIEEMVL